MLQPAGDEYRFPYMLILRHSGSIRDLREHVLKRERRLRELEAKGLDDGLPQLDIHELPRYYEEEVEGQQPGFRDDSDDANVDMSTIPDEAAFERCSETGDEQAMTGELQGDLEVGESVDEDEDFRSNSIEVRRAK